MVEQERTNQHKLKPLDVSIKFDAPEIVSSLAPEIVSSLNLKSELAKGRWSRKYTWGGHHITVGSVYDTKLMERISDETYALGEWVSPKGSDKFEIRLEVLVSTEKNPNAELRDKYFRSRLGVILEEIVFAETALLRAHPELATTKIRVQFQSLDPKYDRTEYWHRLGHWTAESLRAWEQPLLTHNDQKKTSRNKSKAPKGGSVKKSKRKVKKEGKDRKVRREGKESKGKKGAAENERAPNRHHHHRHHHH